MLTSCKTGLMIKKNASKEAHFFTGDGEGMGFFIFQEKDEDHR